MSAPVSSAIALFGSPTVLRTALICWWMSGLVGARKARRPVGNQRWKLNMTTAAISVLPIPVGIETWFGLGFGLGLGLGLGLGIGIGLGLGLGLGFGFGLG